MSGGLAPSGGQPTPLWALAAASYLARYSGNTLRSYTDSLRLLFTWCTDHGLDPLDAKRVHLELFVRYLENDRRNIARSVARHLTPVFRYYRFAVVDDYAKADPTVLLRRPRVFIDESRQLALDKGELQRLLEAVSPRCGSSARVGSRRRSRSPARSTTCSSPRPATAHTARSSSGRLEGSCRSGRGHAMQPR